MTQQLLRTNNLSKQEIFLMALFSTKSIQGTIEKPNSINFRRKVETRLIHLEGINSQMIKISSLSSLLRVLWAKFVPSSLLVLLYLSFSQGTQMSSLPKNNELSRPLELSSLYRWNELKARSNSYWANLALVTWTTCLNKAFCLAVNQLKPSDWPTAPHEMQHSGNFLHDRLLGPPGQAWIIVLESLNQCFTHLLSRKKVNVSPVSTLLGPLDHPLAVSSLNAPYPNSFTGFFSFQSVGEEGLTKLTLHICEEGLRLTEEASHRLNKPISTW